MVSSFGITAQESRKSKEIDLYSDYTKNKLQVLTLAAINSICISCTKLGFGLQCSPWIGRPAKV